MVHLTIPEKGKNPDWFNSFIAAIFYSQYSRKLIKLDENGILEKLKIIFNFPQPNVKDVFTENIKIEDQIKGDLVAKPKDSSKGKKTEVNYSNIDEQNKLIDINFYKYLLTNNKQLTAFILPKFLELIGSSCISVERYNSKNYIGLYDLVEYNKGNISRFFNNSAFILKDIKQIDIKKLYQEPKDYILINKWNKNIPDIFKKVSEKDQDQDEDGIDNKYRLSSTYKKDGDLDITDIIKEQITYNGYFYKLDSCIITNFDDNEKSQFITCLTHEDKKYVYICNSNSNEKCYELNIFDWLKNDFSIHSTFPCIIHNPNHMKNDEKKKNIRI